MRIKYAKPLARFRLSRLPDKRYHLIRNLVTQLMEHQRIVTTAAKAKHMRSTVEALIAQGRKYVYQNKLRYKSNFDKILRSPKARENFFDVVVPRFADRKGTCTRVMPLGNRKGDNAPTAFIELIGK
jgi:large subunit ribosomal protein L17